ncbi:MAG: COG3014 family protein [Cyclobacteriaceae bacterium]
MVRKRSKSLLGISPRFSSRVAFGKIGTIAMLLFTQSCATYYQTNQNFNNAFEQGNLDQALQSLRSNPSGKRGKTEFLYLVNNGLVLSMLGRYEESNEYFEKAYLFGEDYRKNYLNEAASYLTNPTFTEYRGEDHEHLMVLYYKAINYLKDSKYQQALVECRRLNIRLQQLSDRYDSGRKYREDAFVHTLMGIIYEADHDYNNAFIAYRNAYEIYQNAYATLFDLQAPAQLREDILRTAFLTGLKDELIYFEEQFDRTDYQYTEPAGGELVFFWHNGLSPVKSEWGINFVITRKQNVLVFSNPELGLTFPFSIDDYDEDDRKGLADLEVFRVAFPRYVRRPTHFKSATLTTGKEVYPLQEAEDITEIAIHSLEQRMTLEFSKALLRAAVKKLSEHQLKKQDKTLGSVLGIINAITEKADTRNWQTLPSAIHYARVPLRQGKNEVLFELQSGSGTPTRYDFTYEASRGKTLFHTFASLETGYPSYGYY